eukprot:734804-Ditylum_brightwellii.AAC.1
MTGTTYDMDDKNNVFEYPELTRIHDKPITASMFTLRNEIQVNAQVVMTTLRGGANVHLCLVCNSPTYENIPGTHPYTRPVLPITTIPAGATQH